MSADASTRFDLHARVTEAIVKAIEEGAKGDDFEMPWHRPGSPFDMPLNQLTGRPYHGINVLSLWIDADEKRFTRARWATFKQWQTLGAQVRKGEKGSLIVKYGTWTPKSEKASSNEPADDADTGERLYARPAWVFNADQVSGYALEPEAPTADLTQRIETVDRFVAATDAKIEHSGTRAYYRPSADIVVMPPRALFTGTSSSTPTESYYATLLHELSHWTGAETRLARTFGKRFGDDAYAIEELCAELSAAFLCAELHVANAPRADHARYLEHWLRVLKTDTRAIFAASSAASKASAFLHSLQPVSGAAADGSLAA